MRRYLILAFLIVGLFVSFGGCKEKVVSSNFINGANEKSTEKRKSVLVELFTSEGCSSCPPADKLIGLLSKSQPIVNADIIVLSEHVDYWNYLGWKDPYSSEEFTKRQYVYGERFEKGQVYTPQMIINGKYELVGNDKNKAFELISQSAKEQTTEIECRIKKETTNQINIDVDLLNLSILPSNEVIEVMLAVTEDDLESYVRAGENVRKQLQHIGVVRILKPIGELNKTVAVIPKYELSTKVTLSNQWNSNKLKVVVFVQGRRTRQVFGAVSTKI